MFFRKRHAKLRNSKVISVPSSRPIPETLRSSSITETTTIPQIRIEPEKPSIITITPQSHNSPFLALPAELRNQVSKISSLSGAMKELRIP
jgi:hypothetical protein